MEKIHITPEEIPEAEVNTMGRYLIGVIQNFFSDPQNQKEYELWEKERESA